MQLVPDKYTVGFIAGSQDKQLLSDPEHVMQGDVQFVQTLFIDKVPVGQVVTHRLFDNEPVEQVKQFTASVHVAQGAVHVEQVFKVVLAYV